MGVLVDRATTMLINVTQSLANDIRLAEQVETLLGASLLREVTSKGNISFGYGPQEMHYTIYQADHEDRDFLHRVRRALGIPTMKRRLRDDHGTFLWEGTSTVLFDGKPLTVSITAGINGCHLKAIKEIITRTRYEADCAPADTLLEDME